MSADSVEAKQFVSEQDITSATTTATVSDPQPTSSSSSTSSTAVTGVGASSTGTASGPLPSGLAYNVCVRASVYTVRCHWKYLIHKSPIVNFTLSTDCCIPETFVHSQPPYNTR